VRDPRLDTNDPLFDLARRCCFLLTLLQRVEAGQPVPPSHVAILAQLSPDFLEFLADLVNEVQARRDATLE
jgi:hypothetical protein